MIEMNRNLAYFCLRKIVESYMLQQGWGEKDEFYGCVFSIKEWRELDKHIQAENLPDGYYQLCDLLGESYTIGGDSND